jgi:putative nucleotidyltransferase with HDIG domain
MARIRLKALSPQWEGRYWESSGTLRIGRLEGQEVVIDDPSVSRQHAVIYYSEQGWVVRDLGSTNGTYLNNLRVGMVERCIRSGNLLRCGNVSFLAELVEGEAPRLPKETVRESLATESSTQCSWEEALKTVAGLVIENPQRDKRLSALLRVNRYFTYCTSLHQLAIAILKDSVQVLEARSGVIGLWDNWRAQLKVVAVASVGKGGPTAREWDSNIDSLAQRCFQLEKSLLSNGRNSPTTEADASAVQGAMASVICALLRSPRQKLGVLCLSRHANQSPFTEDDLHFADALASLVSPSIEFALLLEKQRAMLLEAITALAQTVEMRDPYTGGHSLRVTEYALMLADAVRLPSEQRRILKDGTPLHDIGKIGIEDRILRKPDSLTPEEFEVMKSHTTQGAAILETLPDLRPYISIARHHHERWDGKGYPDGLKGEEIDLLPRIVAIADAFDAMTSHRPYRPAMPVDHAFQQIRKNAGSQFDPHLAQAFLHLKPQILERIWLRNDAQMDMLIASDIRVALQQHSTVLVHSKSRKV